jgi:hypothetical protein
MSKAQVMFYLRKLQAYYQELIVYFSVCFTMIVLYLIDSPFRKLSSLMFITGIWGVMWAVRQKIVEGRKIFWPLTFLFLTLGIWGGIVIKKVKRQNEYEVKKQLNDPNFIIFR